MTELFLADRDKTELNDKLATVSNVTNLSEALVSLNCNQSDFIDNECQIIDLIRKRSNIYSKALYKIDCNNLTKKQIVDKIFNLYETN